jgi:hypothetical protein
MSTSSHDTGRMDIYGGLVLGFAALAALLVANSPLGFVLNKDSSAA